ncbi:MAG TPA: response regulator [Thermoanaerobaculia bacterium]|nr:response regulator [Thermoanaerobaculia bacterium]
MRLLAIENDAPTRALLTALFGRDGIDVECVDSGSAALAKLGGGGYSAVLLDMMLSDIDGTQVLREMRFLAPELLTKTILLTTAPERTVDSSEREEVFAVLTKPFELADLTDTVRCCMSLN